MAYPDEDEVDWSDGSFGAPSQIPIEAVAGPSQSDPFTTTHDDQGSLFISDSYDHHQIPTGLPLEPAPVNNNDTLQNPTRVQRARTRVHLNRRVPSKTDYMNYALYQASQKAYEATFLNSFVAHALHPDRIAQCSEDATSGHQSIAEYMKSVSHEINGITRKMIWNAHCRTVHLLARDGRDGAPFLDLHTFDSKPFSDYGPGNLFPVADKVNVSWHRTSSHPAMVRYSTKEYELGYQIGPLEEIDDVSQTLLRRENFNGALLTRRAFKPSASKKRKGQNMPGAATRESRTESSSRNWLSFPLLTPWSEYNYPQPIVSTSFDTIHEAMAGGAQQGPRKLSDTPNSRREPASSPAPGFAHRGATQMPFAHPEEPFGHYYSGVPIDDRAGPCIQSNGIEHVDKVHHWRTRLINDHKRRLTRKWGNPPQALDSALQSIRQVVAAAISMGIHPIAHDYQKKIQAMAARKQDQEHAKSSDSLRKKGVGLSAEPATTESRVPHDDLITPSMTASKSGPSKKRRRKDENAVDQVSRKTSTKQKSTALKPSKQRLHQANSKDPTGPVSLSPHPSGSMTLELHQRLPPNAYFEPNSANEKYAWRCGFNHAMGHYYNAGDRKSCRGCNTSLSDNSHVVQMDFYLPSRTFYYQPAPGMRWKPSKQSIQRRKSDRPCHNAVAKDAYWETMSAGATEDAARQMAINAVINYLKPNSPLKAPTPEPKPKPEPEPDLGPHPSGSTTMEHGQEIPDGYYWKMCKANEEHAWRCDVNHALGRYYLAGDKKSCPGCGSCHNGPGKRKEMDFYLPSGVVVRQEAPGLSKYKPRKPYKVSKSAAPKRDAVTHNQICSKVYFELVAEGHGPEEAMGLTVERVDSELDRKQEKKTERQDVKEEAENSDEIEDTNTSTSASRKDSAATSQVGNSRRGQYCRNSRGGCTMSLIPKKRTMDDFSDDNLDEVAANPEDGDPLVGHDPWDRIEESSAEEESSASDSE